MIEPGSYLRLCDVQTGNIMSSAPNIGTTTEGKFCIWDGRILHAYYTTSAVPSSTFSVARYYFKGGANVGDYNIIDTASVANRWDGFFDGMDRWYFITNSKVLAYSSHDMTTSGKLIVNETHGRSAPRGVVFTGTRIGIIN